MNETKIDWAEMSWNPVTGCPPWVPILLRQANRAPL